MNQFLFYAFIIVIIFYQKKYKKDMLGVQIVFKNLIKTPNLIRLNNKNIKLFSSFWKNKFQCNFSTLKSDDNPDQISQQVKKMIQAEKNSKKKTKQLPILKDISQVKQIEQLDQIYRKLTFMTKQNRQIAVKYLLSGIYQKRIPYQAVQDKKIDIVLKQFPNLKLQSQIFRINHLLNKIREIKKNQQQEVELLELYNKINDTFYNAFNNSLKNVPKQQINKSKAILYKNFAEYNFEFLFNSEVQDSSSSLFDQNVQILKKAREFIIQSLLCHKQILLAEYKKLDNDEMNTLKNDDNERHQIKLNAIKQNIRKIVESIGECLYEFFKIINKEHRLLKNPTEFRNRKMELLSLTETYLPFYSIIPGIKQLSVSYFKLYKIKIEAKFTTLNPPKTAQEAKTRFKQVLSEYSSLYKQCEQSLDLSIKSQQFNSIKQISTIMISIKYMMERTAQKNKLQINSLAEAAKDIVDKMKKEWKQPLQSYLLKIIKEMFQMKG